mmetsp:Transcript_8174/g.11235  ORF Transcript_8174/g.11235 Transcript_8174/m.11235 type:complete len:89 (-) Transcript_8174:43-309(-)
MVGLQHLAIAFVAKAVLGGRLALPTLCPADQRAASHGDDDDDDGDDDKNEDKTFPCHYVMLIHPFLQPLVSGEVGNINYYSIPCVYFR